MLAAGRGAKVQDVATYYDKCLETLDIRTSWSSAIWVENVEKTNFLPLRKEKRYWKVFKKLEGMIINCLLT